MPACTNEVSELTFPRRVAQYTRRQGGLHVRSRPFVLPALWRRRGLAAAMAPAR